MKITRAAYLQLTVVCRLVATVLLTCTSVGALASEASRERICFNIGEIGGWVMMDDHVTLIVSRPSAGQLVLFDTVKHRKIKSIEVDFAPNRLAIQRDTLFASVRGSTIIYALNARTGDEVARMKLPGEPVEALSCHRERGPLFAANIKEEVFAIDPKSHSVKKTEARGTMLAMDPAKAEFLLVGTNRPGEDFVEVQRGNGVAWVRLVTVVHHATVFKHAVENGGLRLIGGNTNAAFGDGGSLAISHDGKKFAMAAGGGWQSLTDKRHRYVIAVFETQDMETMLGQVELGSYPRTVAFHPLLNLGAAVRHDATGITIKVFKASSLTDRQVFKLDNQHPVPLRAHRLMFCGRGASLVHHYRDTLTFVPLELSEEERASLDTAYTRSGRGTSK